MGEILNVNHDKPIMRVLLVKGEKGDAGDPSSTISVGKVSTVDPDTPASVTNSGTANNAIFNFSIPKGEKGDKGDAGVTFPIGISQGGTGATDLAGAQAALGLVRLLEFKQLYYDYDKGWSIYAAHGFVWVYAYGPATADGSWDKSVCPYVLPEEYRLKVLSHVTAPVLTNNGASWTGSLVVKADGSIHVANNGNSGSNDARYGIVCYPIGV